MITGEGLYWLGWVVLVVILLRVAWKVTGGRGPR